MWPGATSQYDDPIRYYGDTTGTYVTRAGNYVDSLDSLSWYAPKDKKKPFSLSEFIQNKRRTTEAWHEPFKYELARWRQMGKTDMVLATYFWERTVEYTRKTWLTVDWRWVFKRWLQDLYAT
jgi:hypothetical protein